MGSKTTYFGLAVHQVDGTECVRLADVQRLPFYAFWQESAAGSTQLLQGEDAFVLLLDWEAFSRLFIQTGKHRYSA